MAWVYDSDYAGGQLYSHAGFVLSLRNGVSRSSADYVRGWRAACECGWRSGQEHLATDHPHKNDEVPAEVEGWGTGAGCYGEWKGHLHQTFPGLRVHDLAITAQTTRDQLAVAVAEERAKGVSWQVIATAAGISRQAAHERWAKSSASPPPGDRAVRGPRRSRAGKRSLTLSTPVAQPHESDIVTQFDYETARLLAQLMLEEADAVDDVGRHEDAQRLRNAHHQLTGAMRTPAEANAVGENTSSPFHPVNIAERMTTAVLNNTARRLGGAHLVLQALEVAATVERLRDGDPGERDVIRAVYKFLQRSQVDSSSLWLESPRRPANISAAASRPKSSLLITSGSAKSPRTARGAETAEHRDQRDS